MSDDPKLSRRSAIVAGAWSAPVVALAVATPAAAASNSQQLIVGTNWVLEGWNETFPFHIDVYLTFADGSMLPRTLRMRYVLNGESWTSANETIWAGGSHREASGEWPSNIPRVAGTAIDVTGSASDHLSGEIFVLQPTRVTLTFA